MGKAEWNFNLDELMSKLRDYGPRQQYAWIRARISRMWNTWVDAAKTLGTSSRDAVAPIRRKQVRLA